MQNQAVAWGLALAMTLFSIASLRAAECDAPVTDLQLIKPSQSVSSQSAAFSGDWSGSFAFNRPGGYENVVQCVKMRISVKDNQRAEIGYCTGSLAIMSREPKCFRYDGTINGSTLGVTTTSGAHLVVHINGGGSASAEFTTSQGNKSYGRFSKAQ